MLQQMVQYLNNGANFTYISMRPIGGLEQEMFGEKWVKYEQLSANKIVKAGQPDTIYFRCLNVNSMHT